VANDIKVPTTPCRSLRQIRPFTKREATGDARFARRAGEDIGSVAGVWGPWLRRFLRRLGALALFVVGVNIGYAGVLAFPDCFFAYYTERGRLSLYSDATFDAGTGQKILAGIDARLIRSPIDDRLSDRIFIANADWRQRLFMNIAYGAGGVNFYPITRNVFIRNSDIDADTVYGQSGKPSEKPRTFSYFAAHEIGHTLTAERLGLLHFWNFRLPTWIREGTADYIGLAGDIDVDELYARYRAHDPFFDPKSGHYDRYRLLVAYFLKRKHWSMDQLLLSNMPMQEAEREMNADLGSKPRASPIGDHPNEATGNSPRRQ
jgi:hypothetical protein